jgi:chaperonin GroES
MAKQASSSSTLLRPLGDKILIKRDEAQTKTSSGIFLPETSKEKPMTATIEAVGTGALNTETGERIPLAVKKGERILISKWAGTEVKLNDKEYLIIAEDDILAVIED